MEITYENYISTLFEKSDEKRPALLVLPAWRGKDSFAINIAKEFFEKGYTTLAVDLYGGGKVARDNEEAEALMLPLFLDRKELRKRLTLAFDMLKKRATVEHSIGAMGFCFGGLAAAELLRSGAPLTSAVSLHGLMGDRLGTNQATPEKPNYPKNSHLLILHGAKDPLVTAADVTAFQKELDTHHVDWEMDIYGNAMHAFTNPEAKESESGLLYNERAASRAFARTETFFEETLKRR